MALFKAGISFGPLIVSKMIFTCNSCGHIDIIGGKDYSPDIEKKCPKCQKIMVLSSTNTNTIDSTSLDRSGNWFDEDRQLP